MRLTILLILPIIVDLVLAETEMFRGLGSIADPVAAAAREKAQQKYDISSIVYPELLLAEPFALTRLNINASTRRLVVRESYVTGVDYHFAKGRLYWTDRPTGRLLSMELNPRVREAFYKIDVVAEIGPEKWRPQALAVDHVADKVYVADSRGKRIYVFELDGSRRGVILDQQLNGALDVAVDPADGLLFVADGTSIVRANTDGTSPEAIISHERYHIKSVTLDPASKRIFWSDESFHRIKRANYDGSDYGVVLKNDRDKSFQLLSPASLAIHGSRLYFYDDMQRIVASIETDPATGRANETTYRLIYYQVSVHAMRILDPVQQVELANPCGGNNGGCQDLCLIGPKGSSPGYSCTCEIDRVLAEDLKSCH